MRNVVSRLILGVVVAVLIAVPARAQDNVSLEGRGTTATDPFYLPFPVSRVWLTHDGSRNFSVWAYRGAERELLVNTIGAYSGIRPLSSTSDPYSLDITADGAWTAYVEPIPTDGTMELSGTRDMVSAIFSPPARATLDITHDGSRNFSVWATCAGGRTLVQNEIGAVSASRVVQFRQGPCYWDVKADGNWSLTPR